MKTLNFYIFDGDSYSDNGKWRLFLILMLTLFLPHFMFVSMGLSSLAVGLLVSAFVVLVFNREMIFLKGHNISDLIILTIFVFFLAIYAVISYCGTGSFKPIKSLLILFVLLLSIPVESYFRRLRFNELFSVLNAISLILILLGWLSFITDLQIFNYGQLEKPVFPFSEQSHYALALGLVVLPVIAVASLKVAIFYFINLMLLAFFFPNLTLLVFSFLGCALLLLRMRTSYLIPVVAVLFVMLIYPVYYVFNNVEYFSSRLNFSDIENLTTLVWIQGLKFSYYHFVNTYGIGLGFQALGLSSTYFTYTSDHIYFIAGRINNATDGGFLSAKMISEFGLFGLITSLFYLMWLVKYFLSFNLKYSISKISTDQSWSDENKKILLIQTVLFAFVVEFFFRGYGYFSPGVVVVLASVVYLYKQKFRIVNI